MTTLPSGYIGEAIERITVLAPPQHLHLAKDVVHALQPSAPGVARAQLPHDGWPEHVQHGIAICVGGSEGTLTAAVNRTLARQGVPCLFVAPGKADVGIGPWAYYNHTACWECYQTTLRFFPPGQPDPAQAPALNVAEIAAAVAASLLEILSGESGLIDGDVLTIGNGSDGRCETATRILKDPLCSVCSIWSRQPTEAFYVQSA